MKTKFKAYASLLLAMVLLLALPGQAFACTTIYAGANLTADGSTLFGRSEDYSADYAKLYSAVPAGVHTAGEVYDGCYGFHWTFTHDSYAYTAFCDDNSQGVCPDCGSEHAHTPYQAGGTNEMGLSMTATETLHGSDAVLAVDPYTDAGIEEAEITTVVLSEAASAKEALELLTSIYAEVGANAGSGILLADSQEAWYLENLSGTQYLAVKLNADLLFVEPNIAMIGLIDLKDTENVYASDALIETAVEAGSFVGDEEAQLIDYAASYAAVSGGNTYHRLAAGLNFLDAEADWPADLTAEGIESGAYRLSNVDAEGNTVSLYTNVSADKALDAQSIIDFYKVSPIGKPGNTETHFFQLKAGEDPALETVEWFSMDNAAYNVFVPYYPLLTTGVYEAYEAGCGFAEYVEEEPASGTFFPVEEGVWVVFPEGWESSYYWVFAALSHVAQADEEAAAHITEVLAGVQETVNADWAALQEAVAGAEDPAAVATAGSAAMAEQVYTAALALLAEYGLAEG